LQPCFLRSHWSSTSWVNTLQNDAGGLAD